MTPAELTVAVLGAGGTIAPGGRQRPRRVGRGRRAACCSTSTRSARRPSPASTAGAVRRCARPTRAPGCARQLERLRRARQLRQLPGQPRRDAGVPCGRLPLHRPRRPVLADRRQLELHDEFERAGLLALLGMGSSPGKTNVMAVARRPPSSAPGRADRRDGRRARPRPARRRPSYPYALQTLVDELTMRAGRRARRRAGRRSSRSATAGAVDFGEPIGARRHDLHAALRAAHVPRELRLPGGELPPVAGAGRARAACASWRRRRPSEIAAAAAEALSPLLRHRLGARGRGLQRGTQVRVRAVTEPVERVGARRRGRLDRRSGSRRGAAAGAGPDRGARRAPARALRRARRPVPRAGAPRRPFRGDASTTGGARREGRRPHRDQARRVPRRAHAGRRARADRARPRGAGPVRRRRGQRDRRRRTTRRRARGSCRTPRRCSARPTWC